MGRVDMERIEWTTEGHTIIAGFQQAYNSFHTCFISTSVNDSLTSNSAVGNMASLLQGHDSYIPYIMGRLTQNHWTVSLK